MEERDPQKESRKAVLEAGHDLYERQGYEEFDGAMVEDFLSQSGKQDLPTWSIRRACEYLLETGKFTEANYGTMFSITADGIDEVEASRGQ